MKKLTAAQIEKMWDDAQVSGESIFVRWSRGPKYDTKPSRDYVSGSTHEGLSAVEIGAWSDEYMVRRLSEYRFLRLKDSRIKPYIYTGEKVGLDSDGYELIDVENIKCLGVWNEK